MTRHVVKIPMRGRPDKIDLDIMKSIRDGDNWLYAIESRLPKTQHSTVQSKLKNLEERGYVRSQREGERVLFSLTTAGEYLLSEVRIFSSEDLKEVPPPTVPAKSVSVLTEHSVELQILGANGSVRFRETRAGSATCDLAENDKLYVNTFGSPTWIRFNTSSA